MKKLYAILFLVALIHTEFMGRLKPHHYGCSC